MQDVFIGGPAMYAIYLRKSRADVEAEARGEGETLARHRKQLMELANIRRLPIGRVYEEIVSGDTIADRPQMRKLLRDVEAGLWAGVLVVDVDRLGRGDSIDQGIILKTFKYSGTKIITVYKTYDPNNEMDEEFFEFNQQIARSEYRRIKRRMWAGRVASAREGKYQSPKPPFGYERKKLVGQKGWTLEPVPDQAEAVRMIFDLYVNGENGEAIGMDRIAQRISQLGFKTYGGYEFARSEVRNILSNPTYIGKIRWNQRRSKKAMSGGSEIVTRPRSDEYFVVDGIHPAIVDQEIYDAAQEKLKLNPPHKRCDDALANPFSGIAVCGICGKSMVRTPMYSGKAVAQLRCRTTRCPTSAVDIACVEDAVIAILHEWLKYAEAAPAAKKSQKENPVDFKRKKLEQTLSTLRKQVDNLHDFLEQGIYDADTFVSRNRILAEKIKNVQEELSSLEAPPPPSIEETIISLAPKIKHVLDAYPACKTGMEKNDLLKTVVGCIVYNKTHRCFRNENPADFLTLIMEPVFDSNLQG